MQVAAAAPAAPAAPPAAAAPAPPAGPGSGRAAGAAGGQAEPPPGREPERPRLLEVKSPMVGTFYTAPNPGGSPTSRLVTE
jgi:acetyl-CoA carboxylase biotin carboxyl carrier protein